MTGQSPSRRIFHVTSSLSRNGGGIPPVIWSLARQTQKMGGESMVAGLRDEKFEMDCAGSTVAVVAGQVVGPRAIGFSPELRQVLMNQAGAHDILHVHGLWMYPGWLAGAISRRKGCKRVISPHGMLEPWALKRSAFKKRLVGWCFETRNLRSADCLHALCENEARSFRQFGLRNPIAVIPNGVDLDAFSRDPGLAEFWGRYPQLRGRKIFLFLSRVHPKKGLPDFFHAWAEVRLREQNWVLLVVGPDELAHESELRRLADALGISAQITFAGPAYGEDKRWFLAAADAFVLPSLSEGFSMAVLEAAAAGLPVLLTKECNFPELAAAGAAIETPAGQAGILAGLKQFLSLSETERQQMGGRGRELVRRSYTWSEVASQMKSVYDWLQAGGSRPGCVQISDQPQPP